MRYLQIILATFIAQSYLFGGFAGETIVVVPNGFCLIQDLHVGDKVFGINEQNKLLITRISHTLVQKNKRCLNITIGNQTITVARNQKFLNTQTNKWVKAKSLEVGDTIRIVQFPGIAKVKNIKDGTTRITLYDIRLEDDHVFCITDLTVVVHNCPLFTIGLMWTFNTLADITFSKVVFGIVAPFVCATYALFFNKGSQGKGQLELRAGGQKITKTIYFDDQLRDCGSPNSYQNPNEQTQCLLLPDVNQFLIGLCDGKSYDDPTLVPGICDVVVQVINPERGVCGYSASSNNQRSSDLEGYKDCLISSAYQKNSMKECGSNSKNIKRHSIKESEHEAGKKCATEVCDPPPKGPHGYFIPSDKHKAQAYGDAGAGPTWEDGQKALDQSNPVFDQNGNMKNQRVIIWNNQYLVLRNTHSNVWHGYYSTWDNLRAEQKTAFKKLEQINKKNESVQNAIPK